MTLRIDEERQRAFASLSGDYNPLHVDLNQARRSPFGGCVVHGIHLVLAAVEALGLSGATRIVALDAQFRAAVLVGDSVSITHDVIEGGGVRVSVRVGQQLRAVLNISLEPASSLGAVAGSGRESGTPAARPSPSDIPNLAGTEMLAFDPGTFATLFPQLASTLVAEHAAVLLAVTRVVGMKCPGQWALFRRLLWRTTTESKADVTAPSSSLDYRVASFDHRFEMATVVFDTHSAELSAEVIVRSPPPKQATFEVVRGVVDVDEFSDVRALVVGGSRGLGELAAKVLAAGSAQVLLTYHTGADDAADVVDQLNGAAQMVQLSMDAPAAESLERIRRFAPNHISYFATPSIAKRPPSTWDPATYERFMRVYVEGLSRLLVMVDGDGSLDSVLFPSSTFVDDAPTGFGEYIAAKLAGEALCREWQRIRPAQRVLVERFPPLVTDQTAGLLGADTRGNLDTLVPVLRRIRGAVNPP